MQLSPAAVMTKLAPSRRSNPRLCNSDVTRQWRANSWDGPMPLDATAARSTVCSIGDVRVGILSAALMV
jgi:hypothetical protein